MKLGTTSLRDACRLREFKRKRISSYDRTGGNQDFYIIPAGEKKIIAEIHGAGCITHIWVTMANSERHFPRNVIIRMWWDGEQNPSVEAPIGDFFGCGHGKRVDFVSAPLQMSPQRGKGFNCWWPMPYEKKAIIEIENDTEKQLTFYFYVDYEEYKELPKFNTVPIGRFHAWFNRGVYETMTHDRDTGKKFGRIEWQISGGKNTKENGGYKENHLIADIKGKGQYVGANINIVNPNYFLINWPGEGDDMIFIDGDEEPTLYGTGTEDYINTAYSPTYKHCAPYHGIIIPGKFNYLGQITYYRYHIEDPVSFEKSAKVTIEHGHDNHRGGIWDTTAYWYQIEPHEPFPPLPAKKDRMPVDYTWNKARLIFLLIVILGWLSWKFWPF